MHKATVRFSVDLKTWHLSESDISNLRAGICSDVFQEELSKRHIYTTFHGCKILNVYVKEKELVFIIQPDWNNVAITNIFAENNSYLENYLYESVVVNLIGIGKNINSQAKLKELGETIKEMPTALPFVGVKIDPSSREIIGWFCPYEDCKKDFNNVNIKAGIKYCPHCNKPVIVQSYLNPRFPPIIGVDVAGAMYQDSSAITVVDSKKYKFIMEVVCNGN